MHWIIGNALRGVWVPQHVLFLNAKHWDSRGIENEATHQLTQSTANVSTIMAFIFEIIGLTTSVHLRYEPGSHDVRFRKLNNGNCML